jgi:hypothetical protein
MKAIRPRLALVFGLSLVQLAPAAAQNPVDIPTTNRSVTITTGNTFQQILAATADTTDYNRKSLTIQNNNTSDSCWIFIGAGNATKAASIILDTTHGSAYTRFYPYIPSDAIQATCTGNGDTLYVDTQ